MPPPGAAGAAVAGSRSVAIMSSLVMRPFGPVPETAKQAWPRLSDDVLGSYAHGIAGGDALE